MLTKVSNIATRPQRAPKKRTEPAEGAQDTVTLSPRARRANRGPDAPYMVGGELYKNFADRPGYDPDFLGESLPLPVLDESIRDLAAPLLEDESQTELKYTHYSAVMHKERRMPMFTAANVDGAQYVSAEREGTWVIDGRMDRKYQMGNEAYVENPFDRGHMTRRSDIMWGPNADAAQHDSFVYTNAALQHSQLNQRKWAGLENHILGKAIESKTKVTVFTGPIFADNDAKFDNKGKMPIPTKMPSAFYKVVVSNEPGQGLRGEAYVMSQKEWLDKPGRQGRSAENSPDWTPYRVPLSELEKITKIDFGPMADTVSKPEPVLIG